MHNLAFLQSRPPGRADLLLVTPDGISNPIHGLDLSLITARCPVLAFSFEAGANGLMKSSLDVSSYCAGVCFLRFLYTGDYLPDGGLAQPPLLIHAEVCRMADIFECPGLQLAAHMNIVRSTELACSLPTPTDDLCRTIRFLYAHLSSQRPLIDTILHYCVACFTYHQLGMDPEFQKLAAEHELFHMDLSRINRERGFENADIFKLSGPQREVEDVGDFIYHLWSDDAEENKQDGQRSVGLAHRPGRRSPAQHTDSEDSMSEVDGFTVVPSALALRPKRNCVTGKADSAPYSASASASATTTGDDFEFPQTKVSQQDNKDDLSDSHMTIKPKAWGQHDRDPSFTSTEHGVREGQNTATADEDRFDSDSDWSIVEAVAPPGPATASFRFTLL